MYDDDDDDDFATLGTPFAPLEADEIVSRKPEIDQTVRDERGRRRFHGAFTGGFSAGYWNTVGSAEGFTPKIFLSSRKNKYDQSLNAKPEDFMDDEDFGSFGIAPKRIHTKEDFVENSSFAGLRNVDLTFDDVIKSVFQPAKESIGKRLFRKMKRNAKIEQKDRRANVLGLDEEEPATKKQNEIQFEPKDNFHGLGYNGMLDPNNFLYADPTKSGKKGNDYVSATLSGGRRIKITGEAFGYGALEEDDNMAVYAKDDMSQYDFSIGSVQKAAKLKNKRIPFPNGNTIELEGFAQTSKRVNLFNDLRKDYKTPEFPRNWRPKRVGKAVKKSRWDAKSLQDSLESTGSLSNSATTTTTTKQQSMNANLRAVILGEEVVYKTGIAKRKQDDDKNFQPNELAFDKVLHSTADMKKPVQSELSSKQTPLSGFFASKFTRSSSFVEDSTISAGLSTFKDISSMPSFESRSKPVEDEENVNKKPTRITFEWHPHKLVCKRFGLQNPFPQYTDIVGIVSIDGSQKARNMTSTLLNTKSSSKAMFSGLFQNLTELNTFNPVISNSSKDEKSNVPSTTTTTKSERSSGPSRVSESIQNIKNNTQDKKEQSLEADIKVPRPPIDLFKSIFASDEEDGDDEENEEPHQTDKNIQKSDLIVTIDNRVNKEDSDGKEKSTLSKSGGIFSGVDFQQLNQNFNPCLKATTSQKPVDSTEQKLDESDESDDCYGPALPPSSVPVSVYNANKNLPKGVHSDVKEHRKSRKYKDKKKRKDKRKKDSKKSSKKSKDSKGRKRKRHTSGSSNSSQSSQSSPSEDVEGQLLELIKRARHGH